MSSIIIPERKHCTDYEVHIVEQPAPRAQRFRYATEVDGSRTVGSIPGISSRAECPTYPKITVRGRNGPYTGPMLVIVCLVNPEDDLVHPHTITGRPSKSEYGNQYQNNGGVLFFVTDGPDVTFNNIGIICVKSKSTDDVNSALQHRKDLRIDPFRKRFPHMQHHDLIDFSAVRLCFNVFLPGKDARAARLDLAKYPRPLRPVCSTVVYDTKKFTDLKILRVNTTVPMKGGTEMLLFCEKFTGSVPDVIFERDGWTAKANDVHAHKRYGLYFTAPPYEGPPCQSPVQVSLYLQKTNAKGEVERSERALVEYIEETKPFKVPPKNYLSLIQQKPLPRFDLPPVQEPILPSISQNPEWLEQPTTSTTNPHQLAQAAHSLSTNQADPQAIYKYNMIYNMTAQPAPVSIPPEPTVPEESFYYHTETLQPIFGTEEPEITFKEDQTPNVLLFPQNYYNNTPDVISDFVFDEDTIQRLTEALQSPSNVGNEIEMISDELKNQHLQDDVSM